jgi:hypothetical protein
MMPGADGSPELWDFEPFADFDRLLNAEAKKAVPSRKRLAV